MDDIQIATKINELIVSLEAEKCSESKLELARLLLDLVENSGHCYIEPATEENWGQGDLWWLQHHARMLIEHLEEDDDHMADYELGCLSPEWWNTATCNDYLPEELYNELSDREMKRYHEKCEAEKQNK